MQNFLCKIGLVGKVGKFFYRLFVNKEPFSIECRK